MDTQKTLRYLCEKCAAELIIVKDSDGILECCGEKMILRKYKDHEYIVESNETNT